MLGKLKFVLTIISLPVFMVSSVYATAQNTYSASPNYQVNEVFFGAGGSQNGVNPSSANYSAIVSVGENGVGNYSSPNFQAQAGFNTTAAPFLEMYVYASNLSLNTLTTSTTGTVYGTSNLPTAQFYVRAWNSSGYIVQTSGPSPTNTPYHMATPVSPQASTPGTEQFGMNLRANTQVTGMPNPGTTFGADAVQTLLANTTPISYGVVSANYNTPNLYYYHDGDTVAYSTQSTSSTSYTLSYIFNISGNTPGGAFTFNQNLVATATY